MKQSTSSKFNLAILILHYNTPEITTELCNSIPEAIVIDNGSHPAKRLKVKNRIIQLDKNYGFTKGWNKGIALASCNGMHYDAYWLMNSDIEIDRGSVERVRRAAVEGTFDIFTPSYNCWIKDCQPGYLDKAKELGVIEFTAPVILRRTLDAIGMFDEAFALGYGVEYDYCYRAKQAGLKIGVIPDASFYHHGSSTIQLLGFKSYLKEAQSEHVRELRKKYGDNYFDVTHKDVQMKSDFEGNHLGMISVYTTIFGDYDTLKPHAWSQIPARWICVTDNPKLKCEGWTVVVAPKMFGDPRQNAKFYKVHPWEVPGLEDVNISIFLDGTMEVKSEIFIEWMVLRLYNDMLLFRHPERDCIYEEAIVSESIKYYSGSELKNQIKAYSKHVKPNSGLWACGCLVRKHTPFVRKLMDDWWIEQLKYTLQDQISFVFVCQKNNFIPSTLKEDIFNNKQFKIIPHKKDKSMVPVKDSKNRMENKTPTTDRIRIINNIIRKKGYARYLEIGQAYGNTFLAVQCQFKDGLEIKPYPNIKPTFNMTSDQFFAHFRDRLDYDLIFIDGDHERKQVLADIRNSLAMLRDGGCLVLHDTNPPNERFTKNDLCFNAYQALVDVMFDKGIKVEIHTVTLPDDQGNGISVIFKSAKKYPVVDPNLYDHVLTYKGFEELRNSGKGWIMEEDLYKLLTRKK